MLRTRQPTRLLGPDDVDAALDLCARDPAAHVFVASRILDGGLGSGSTAAYGWFDDGELEALVWTLANVVPVATSTVSWAALAAQVRKVRRRSASFLGPREEVHGLWRAAGNDFPAPRTIRGEQPLMASHTPPSQLGVRLDPRVRPATLDEVDLVLPAAEHMFTQEIGYRPYTGSPAFYRDSIWRLVRAGRTYVVIEGGRVIFKADVGSVALGTCQIQGVWLSPELRGQGLAASMMAAALEQSMIDHAPLATLYVNDFNAPALATYRRIGMERVGTFSTILF
ncbi:GNAT family N-acetyltransferase [Janibacter limosus]|uniref:GNAT family N-acetyltransferase n=1 Tax=Janibacter limosus TaxID=53458 RepID=UPI0008363452|nr:GNAT family N-acetyltransferase [Janibacter limosus]